MTTSCDEIADLTLLLEPWLDIETTSQPYAGALTSMAFGPYGVEGSMKTGTTDAPLDGSARGTRAMMLMRAEEGLKALEEAGWHLTAYPVMEFSGHVRPFTQTLDGRLVEPSRQERIMLRVRLEVNRAR